MDEAWVREVAQRYQLDDQLVEVLRAAVADPTLATLTGLSGPTVDSLLTEGAADTAGPTPDGHLGRYVHLGLLGRGGMGEVFRVRDPALHRAMAAKVLKPTLSRDAGQVARFLEEAQVTAQLRHPGVVPVHELGRLQDGRVYFTMQEVEGQTLADLIQALHAASGPDAWAPTASGWTFRRLVEAFRRACETVAYAHSRGVVHRDLKPANVMLGEFGQVLVLDWGLAKVRGHQAAPRTERSQNESALATHAGRVFGTPAYMPPEQARGDWERVGPAADVYALGAILYTLLTGATPYRGTGAEVVLRRVLTRPPQPLSEWEQAPPLPAGLVEICEHAMAREVQDRPADAGVLAEQVAGWLDGSLRRTRALVHVVHASAAASALPELEAMASALRRDAARSLEGVLPSAPIADKRAGWALQDRARAVEAEARTKQVDQLRSLQTALKLDPDLPEANHALATLYRDRHAQAEALGDTERAREWELLLRDHDHGPFADYLQGDGRLTLVTDPPAHAQLYAYVTVDRRRVARPLRSLGQTPVHALVLPRGDYLIELSAPGHETVRYPVSIARQQHWDGIPPGQQSPQPVRLPALGELGPDDVFLPAGWFWLGGDPGAPDGLPRERMWVGDRVVRRHPVTNAEYCAFLNDLEARGLPERARQLVPQGEAGPMLFRDRHGTWRVPPKTLLFVVEPDTPVILVDWHSASAYAAWEAERSGLPWQLPDEITWEKASRGVDGRLYPWGDHLDPCWVNVRDSFPDRPRLAPVGHFPDDCSPYGVRGMGGNVMDWCADAFRTQGAPRVGGRLLPVRPAGDGARCLRGGHFYAVEQISRSAHRYRLDPAQRGFMIGFRLARPWTPGTDRG